MLKLDEQTRLELIKMRRVEKDLRKHIKLSVILNLDRGLSPGEVAAIFGIDDATVYRYLAAFKTKSLTDYIKGDWVSFSSKLTEHQLEQLREEVSSCLYNNAKDIKFWIKYHFRVDYHVKQVVKLLHKLGYVYKKTKIVPGKANKEAQEKFIAEFEQLMKQKPAKTKVFFNDGVHPRFTTRSDYGWIKKGEEFEIKSNPGRQGIHITGAIDAENPINLFSESQGSVNAQSTIALWENIELSHPKSDFIHICDNARYYHSKVIKEWLKAHPRTKIKYLPTYSPNLNPIERVWKLLKKEK